MESSASLALDAMPQSAFAEQPQQPQASLQALQQEMASAAAMPAAAAPRLQDSLPSQNADGRSSSASAGASQHHPNVFVRGLPLLWSEGEITAVFQQYGPLSSLRLVRHSATKQSLGYGFVRFQDPAEAQAAISALDGTSVLGHTLQVKFADADAGPPTSATPSGLTPSDSCYAKHLPSTYGVVEVQALFEVHGAVLDVKLFPCLDAYRGASALVRMASLEASDRAIAALNNATPPGAVQSLIVRYAESPTEKAARLTRRERQQSMQRNGLQGALSGALDPLALQQALAALSMNGLAMGGPTQLAGHLASMSRAASMPAPMVSAPLIPQQYQPPVHSSICIKGMPPNADRLWIYENFARFGAVVGMRILIDEQSGLCNGTAFINYADHLAAERSRQAMNGMRAGDKVLHVMVQNHGHGGRLASRESSLGGPLQSLPPQTEGEWQSLLQGGAMVW